MKNDIQKFWNQHIKIKPWIPIAAVIAIGLVSYYGYMGFRYWSDSTLLEDLSARLTQVSVREPDFVSQEAHLDSQKEIISEITRPFDFPDADQLTALITQTASESEVDIKSITAIESTPEVSDGILYQVHAYKLAISGDLESMFEFVTRMSQTIGVTKVDGFKITNPLESPSGSIDLAFYLSPEIDPESLEQEGEGL